MNGDFPPSSSESVCGVAAVALRIARPTSVEPVNAILSTSGCFTSASPVEPSPVTMLTTPAGTRLLQISAKASAVSGVNSAGFRTTVFPVASAGAIFHASISKGKFQGMIWPTTPQGTYQEILVEELRPTRVVVEMPRHQRNVDVAALADGLAVVHGFQNGQSRECFCTSRASAYR